MAVFVTLLDAVQGLPVVVAPDHHAHPFVPPIPPVESLALFCIVPPVIENVHRTYILNHAGLRIAHVDTVRLL